MSLYPQPIFSWVKLLLFPFVICYLSSAITAPAAAAYISLNTSLTSKVAQDKLKVSVAVVNQGDEAAFNVQAEIKVGGKTVLAEKKTELAINETYKTEETFKLTLAKPGTYPLTLIMHYTDANQYPFSALTVQSFVLGKEAPIPLFGQVKATTFSKESKLQLTLKNLSDSKIKIKTYFVAPRELTVGAKALENVLPEKSERSISFAVKNFSALAGSTYQIFAVAEFEDEGLHYTSIFPGSVKIVARQEFLGLNYNAIFIILAALVVVFIGAQFLKRKGGAAPINRGGFQ